jgi:hypothetical protein
MAYISAAFASGTGYTRRRLMRRRQPSPPVISSMIGPAYIDPPREATRATTISS